MQTNLHKSEEGWQRFRERTNSGERAHRAKMRFSPRPQKPPTAVVQPDAEPEASIQPRLRNRRRVVIDRGRP